MRRSTLGTAPLLNHRTAAFVALGVVLAGAPGRAARAEPHTYRPVPSGDGPASLRIDVPYTFGTHNFEVRDVRGEARVDWQPTPVVTGQLKVALASLRGGSDTLNCHMRESMGLDYAKSAFPRSHVCAGGKLPTSGNDAVAFPEITFEIKSVTIAGDRARAAIGGGMRVIAAGRWTIHGVTRDDTIELQLTVAGGEPARPRSIRIEGLRKLRLADYGIQVKRALVITAGDDATVRFNLVLEVKE